MHKLKHPKRDGEPIEMKFRFDCKNNPFLFIFNKIKLFFIFVKTCFYKASGTSATTPAPKKTIIDGKVYTIAFFQIVITYRIAKFAITCATFKTTN